MEIQITVPDCGGGSVSANNGLSVDAGKVVLGQSYNAVGNPALITDDRILPMDYIVGGNGGVTVNDTNRQDISVSIYPGELDILTDNTATSATAFYIRDIPSSQVYEIDTHNFTSGFGYKITGCNGIVYTPNLGVKVTDLPTAYLHLGAGTTSPNTAPLKLTSGPNLSTPEDGAIEYDGSHFYGTIGSTRFQLDQQAGSPQNFANTNLTFTGDRTHDVNQHSLTITNSSGILLQANDVGPTQVASLTINPNALYLSGNAVFFSPSQDGVISATINSSTPGTQVGFNMLTTGVTMSGQVSGANCSVAAVAAGEVQVSQTITSGSSNLSALNIQASWNTTGSMNGIYLNVQDVASGFASTLMDLQLNGQDVFVVSKQKEVKIGGSAYIGATNISPTAKLHIDPGTATAGTAPLKLTAGTNLTTAENGAFEFNGTNLFFTRTGSTRENILVGNSGASAPSTTAAGSVTNRYGGATNFLGDPAGWASVVISGTTYKIPLYT
jgi:hypothetical protein